MNISKIFNLSLIYSSFRSATPIIYAALCASITQQADILNIGTEGIMLVGAFMAVAISYLTGSFLLAIFVAMLSGLLIAMLMAVGHIRYKADICAIGMGINLFAIAITKFLLNTWLKQNGTFSDPKIATIPRFNVKFLENVPILGEILNDISITEIFVIILIALMYFAFYKTVWGLRLRSVGRMPQAAASAGINVNLMKYQAIAISGLIGGLAGAHLSIGYSKMFVENMTNQRGFMGVAAMYFGNADPILTSLACLVFGFSDSVGSRLQAYGVPSQLVLMLPYIVTILILAISMITKLRREKRRKSSLIK
jgi:inner-membrane translocator